MSEPKLYFYDRSTVTPLTQLSTLNFYASDGSTAIKAGSTSKVAQIAIANAPDSSCSATLNPPGGNAANWNTDTTVSDATQVDITTRDGAGGTGGPNMTALGGDVVSGAWLNVFSSAAGAVMPSPDPSVGVNVGFVNGSAVYARVTNDIPRGTSALTNAGYVAVDFKLITPGNAAAGARSFYIRVSYSFTQAPSMDGVGFSGRFTFEVWEDDRLIEVHHSSNRILRSGLVAIVQHGIAPGMFNVFAVGSDGSATDGKQTGLLAELDYRAFGSPIPNMPFPTWGYTATFDAGQATGLWRETGMANGLVSSSSYMLNRAPIYDKLGNQITINKTASTVIKVSVKFSIFRT